MYLDVYRTSCHDCVHHPTERNIFETAEGDVYARFNASNRKNSALLLIQLATKVDIEWFNLLFSIIIS